MDGQIKMKPKTIKHYNNEKAITAEQLQKEGLNWIKHFMSTCNIRHDDLPFGMQFDRPSKTEQRLINKNSVDKDIRYVFRFKSKNPIVWDAHSDAVTVLAVLMHFFNLKPKDLD